MIEYLKERYFILNLSVGADRNVVVQIFNLKSTRTKLTVAQLRCALKGKEADFNAALVESFLRPGEGFGDLQMEGMREH